MSEKEGNEVKAQESLPLCGNTVIDSFITSEAAVEPVNQSQSESIVEAEIIKVGLDSTSYNMHLCSRIY
jgi:hypothetical protein